MIRTLIVSAIVSAGSVSTVTAAGLASIVDRVSANCNAIVTYEADAQVRYHI